MIVRSTTGVLLFVFPNKFNVLKRDLKRYIKRDVKRDLKRDIRTNHFLT